MCAGTPAPRSFSLQPARFRAEGRKEASTRNHELLMHSHLFAAARGLLASGEQVIDVTFKFTFLRGEGWRAASGGGEPRICDSGY